MLQMGDVVGGRYLLDAPIAAGGMGTVWRARHVELGVDVALKLMLAELANTPSAEQRFRTEAQAAAKLRSPHVVSVMDFGVHDGQPYLVMELLRGQDLEARLANGPLALDACATILDEVARAVDLAHQLGIIHRDLKPANIFLAQDGDAEVVKVLDFGVAKVTSPTSPAATTGAGLIGSPAYMSPEQVWCEPLTAAADLWSLAVVAFEMITGENPFVGGPLVKVFERIARDDLPRPRERRPELPVGLDPFFERALSRDVAARFASAAELSLAFRAAVVAPPIESGVLGAPGALDDEEVLAPTGAQEASVGAPSRQRTIVALAALGALVVAGVAVVVTPWRSSGTSSARAPGSGAPLSEAPSAVASAKAPPDAPTSTTSAVVAPPAQPRASAVDVATRSTAARDAPASIGAPSPSANPSARASASAVSRDPMFGIPKKR